MLRCSFSLATATPSTRSAWRRCQRWLSKIIMQLLQWIVLVAMIEKWMLTIFNLFWWKPISGRAKCSWIQESKSSLKTENIFCWFAENIYWQFCIIKSFHKKQSKAQNDEHVCKDVYWQSPLISQNDPQSKKHVQSNLGMHFCLIDKEN